MKERIISLESVLEVKHFTENLFWFKTTKPECLKDLNHVTDGQFVMIGLPDTSIPMRAYSFANPAEEDHLEFLSIHVPNGPLTSRLKDIKIGDKIRVENQSYGTLLLQALDLQEPDPSNTHKRRLWLISTGTGLAPFLSIARSKILYDEDLNLFDEIIVTHTCRTKGELVFRQELENAGATVYQTVTQEEPEENQHNGRITELIHSGKIFKDLKIEADDLNPKWDRVMLCGNMPFNKELISMLENRGFAIGTVRSPGTYLKETAFVDK